MRALSKLFLLIATAAAMSVCSAATLVGNVGNDAAFNTYMTSIGVPGFNLNPVDATAEIFAAQGRIGNNSLNTGEYEVGLHQNPAPFSTPPTSSAPLAATTGGINMVWGSPGFANTLFGFALTRAGNTVSFRLFDGLTTIYESSFTDAKNSAVNLLDLRAAANANASTTSSRAQLTDLLLVSLAGAQAIPSVIALDNANDSALVVANYVISGLTGDFTLTGNTSLDWTGTTPARSNLAWQIKGFETPVPEPASMLLIGLGLIGLKFVGRRRAA